MNGSIALLTLTMGAALVGCATAPPVAGGGGPAYSAGYNDGCQSGAAAQGSPYNFYARNAGRFDTDPQYAAGWSAGYQRCADQQMQKNASGNGR